MKLIKIYEFDYYDYESGSIMSILREVTVTYSAEPVERNKIVNLEDTKND